MYRAQVTIKNQLNEEHPLTCKIIRRFILTVTRIYTIWKEGARYNETYCLCHFGLIAKCYTHGCMLSSNIRRKASGIHEHNRQHAISDIPLLI